MTNSQNVVGNKKNKLILSCCFSAAPIAQLLWADEKIGHTDHHHKNNSAIVRYFYPCLWKLLNFFLNKILNFFLNKIFEDISPVRGATNTPVLDFWWRLPWVSKPGWIPCMLSHLCAPHIHLQCDTCWLYRGQHGSRAARSKHGAVFENLVVTIAVGRWKDRAHRSPSHKQFSPD